MTLPTSAYRPDQDARALRERLELVVLGDDEHAIAEAARALVRFCWDHPEYPVCSFRPESLPPRAEPPKRILSKFPWTCRGCGKRFAVDSWMWWSEADKGTRCDTCGSK